ncbi:hypothetical protein GHT06_010141 [Daphnia sinensis]|uniref:Uncharacterized protein n=1 Tax=Daphnia sinensis TaxID=1820382 RepID=A0AAD5L0J0_9CRUS|nr:hypothetical protein GHT06_010141 [Daphnia sinensis]
MIFIAISVLLYIAVWHQQSTYFHSNSIQISETEGQQKLENISPTCNCNGRTTNLTKQQSFNPDAFQWCSSRSSQRGTHQNVIAYTVFGNVNERYYSLLTNISSTAEKFYPGWIVRFYHNFSNQSEEAYRKLCNVYCQFNNVDLCSVPELIERIRDTAKNKQVEPIEAGLLQHLNPRMYRYLVAFDPNVDIFISRDVDSMIWKREVDAVEQWLQSNYTFHVMRDCIRHEVLMLAGPHFLFFILNFYVHFDILNGFFFLAGMWGAKLQQRRYLIEGLMRAIIPVAQNQIKQTDQIVLKDIVWPTARFDVMLHDSYYCQNPALMARTLPLRVYPFPTQRKDRHFVGDVGQHRLADKCPRACRPPDHKDWEYC